MKLKSPFSESDFNSLFELGLQFRWLKTCEEGLLELWMSTGQDENQKRLIKFLLHNFHYVDSDQSVEYCRQIAKHITEDWGLKAHNTLIVAACDHSRPDGSQVIVQKLKNHFPYEWKEFDFVNSLSEAAYALSSNDNLVICDDFIGTGNTIKRKIRWVKKILGERWIENVQIYIVAFAAMNFSRNAIPQWLYPQYSCKYLPKGISETLTGDNLTAATSIMEQMERLLKPQIGRLRLPHFGYQRSESLFDYQDDNIPNNVFPIFWWKKFANKKYRTPMFRRV